MPCLYICLCRPAGAVTEAPAITPLTCAGMQAQTDASAARICKPFPVAGQRERMLKSTEKMDKTTDRIAQGRQQLAETEVRCRADWAAGAATMGKASQIGPKARRGAEPLL